MAKRKTQKKRTTKKTSPKKKPAAVVFAKSTVAFFRDEKVKFVLAMFALLFAIFLTIAFISFFFTWDSDQRDMSWTQMVTDTSIQVDNWAGKTGAAISKQFIHNWFGLPSFAFIFLLIIISFKLINIEILPFKKTVKYTLLITIWSSITLGFIFGNLWDANFGGMHGYFMSKWLESTMGVMGTIFLLLITMLAFIVFTFENSVQKIKSYFHQISAQKLDKQNTLKNDFVPEEDIKFSSENDKNSKNNTKKSKRKAEKPRILDEDDDPKGTAHREEFILTDDGKKKEVNELGFEIEKPEETIIPSTSTDNKQQAKEDSDLAFRVQKSEDITAEDYKNRPIEDFDPTKELSAYQLPSLDLLNEHQIEGSEVSNEELINNKNKIVETLANYKIEIVKIKATIGPTITLYEIVPAPGIRISKIKNLEDDIALSLAALGIRIIAPMPGRGTIGIEVPNQKPQIVSMKSVLSSSKYQNSKHELPIAIGKTISNESYVADLTKMPHLLVAGATGQGKSVGLNAILASLLYKKHPSQVKFVLVDPKKVELSIYEKIERHFLAKLPDAEEPIITENEKVIHTLSSLNVEMDKRYDLLKKALVRNIKEYNDKFVSRRLNPEKGHEYLPYIILVIDEFADLIMTAGKEVELPIARLAQLARAVGIHLIVATQRPSTNIITGVIKANFPTRVAFKVASMIDSRTILDSPGANQLIGRGDMLITRGSDLIRLQCAFIDTSEIDKITDFIGSQRAYPSAFQLPQYETGDDADDPNKVDLSKRDELFDDAARVVVMNQQGSTSLIQRKLSIGYNRAGRIIDQLEAAGIVGPFEGSKARQVLYSEESSLEQYLNEISAKNG